MPNSAVSKGAANYAGRGVILSPDFPPIRTNRHGSTTSGNVDIVFAAMPCGIPDTPLLCQMYSRYVHMCNSSDLPVVAASGTVDSGCAVVQRRLLSLHVILLSESPQGRVAEAIACSHAKVGATAIHR